MADYTNPIEFEPGQLTADLDNNTHNSEDTEASGSTGTNQNGASAYTFDNYQDDAGTTAIYPGAGLGTPDSINYTILGLIGEAGEIANKWKKFYRDNEYYQDDNVYRTTEESLSGYKNAIRAELGDVLWYAARLAEELGVNLSTIAAENIRKLQDRKQRDKLHGSGDDR